MKILQKIKEWKLNRPESQWSKKKLAIAGAALVVAVGLGIGGKILVEHWQFKNYKVITRTELEDTMKMCGVTSLKEITRASVWMK